MISKKQYKHIMKLAKLKRKPKRICNCGTLIKNFYAKRCRKCWKQYQKKLMLDSWKKESFKKERINSMTNHIISQKTKDKISKSNIGKKAWNKNKKFPHKKGHKETNKNTINKHHIDLNTKNNAEDNILKLTLSNHTKIHRYAYHYLVKINKIKEYIKWFQKTIQK